MSPTRGRLAELTVDHLPKLPPEAERVALRRDRTPAQRITALRVLAEGYLDDQLPLVAARIEAEVKLIQYCHGIRP